MFTLDEEDLDVKEEMSVLDITEMTDNSFLLGQDPLTKRTLNNHMGSGLIGKIDGDSNVNISNIDM